MRISVEIYQDLTLFCIAFLTAWALFHLYQKRLYELEKLNYYHVFLDLQLSLMERTVHEEFTIAYVDRISSYTSHQIQLWLRQTATTEPCISDKNKHQLYLNMEHIVCASFEIHRQLKNCSYCGCLNLSHLYYREQGFGIVFTF